MKYFNTRATSILRAGNMGGGSAGRGTWLQITANGRRRAACRGGARHDGGLTANRGNRMQSMSAAFSRTKDGVTGFPRGEVPGNSALVSNQNAGGFELGGGRRRVVM